MKGKGKEGVERCMLTYRKRNTEEKNDERHSLLTDIHPRGVKRIKLSFRDWINE